MSLSIMIVTAKEALGKAKASMRVKVERVSRGEEPVPSPQGSLQGDWARMVLSCSRCSDWRPDARASICGRSRERCALKTRNGMKTRRIDMDSDRLQPFLTTKPPAAQKCASLTMFLPRRLPIS